MFAQLYICMWLHDVSGTVLDGPETAREELRRRAQLAISAGLKAGRDCSHIPVRLRDEQGNVLFEGTMAEAAACELHAFVVPKQSHFQAWIERSKRLRDRAIGMCINLQFLTAELMVLQASLMRECEITRELLQIAEW